jgi:hypothetical protein
MRRVRLQPLRIPTGWRVDFNDGLHEVDPTSEAIPEHELSLLFKEDMLQAVHPARNRMLDLGWYPEGELKNGQYRLELYEGDFGGRLLHRVLTRDRAALVDSLERILQAVCDGDPEFGPYGNERKSEI